MVIGAGQAGLSAGFHLQRRGFMNGLTRPGDGNTFVILDANPAPGGAWQHRWESLRVSGLNGIFDLPSFPRPEMTGDELSREAIPGYFAEFEAMNQLPIVRPVSVTEVRNVNHAEIAAGAAPKSLHVATSRGVWTVQAVINATGTWNNPVLPVLDGSDLFEGVQLHTRDYRGCEEFAGQRVAIVGGGISALQHLEEISRVASTAWYTRRPPQWRSTEFTTEAGRETIDRVTADVEAGRPTGSVVSYTGLPWASYAQAAHDRGALARRPMFTSIEPAGVREFDGSFTSLDAIVWATGFKADLAHLSPLALRNAAGGVEMRGTRTAVDERVHLIGFGPSQSTVGANRAGKSAVEEIVRYLTAGA